MLSVESGVVIEASLCVASASYSLNSFLLSSFLESLYLLLLSLILSIELLLSMLERRLWCGIFL